MDRRGVAIVVVLAVATAVPSLACSSGGSASSSGESLAVLTEVPAAYPAVLDAVVTAEGATFTVAATLWSPYDSEERYADAFRVLAPDGAELGVRPLTHPHAEEQPFTRSLTGLVIPDGVEQVTVEGRDLRNGWGGTTVTVAVPGR